MDLEKAKNRLRKYWECSIYVVECSIPIHYKCQFDLAVSIILKRYEIELMDSRTANSDDKYYVLMTDKPVPDFVLGKIRMEVEMLADKFSKK